jgi:hypothetical protein
MSLLLALFFATSSYAAAPLNIRQECDAAAEFGTEQIAQDPSAIESLQSGDWQKFIAVAKSRRLFDSEQAEYSAATLGWISWMLEMPGKNGAAAAGYRLALDETAATFYQIFSTEQITSGKTRTGVPAYLLPYDKTTFSAEAIIRSELVTPITAYTPAEVANTRARIAAVRSTGAYEQDHLDLLKEKAEYFCAFHGSGLPGGQLPSATKACTKGLRELLTDTQPYIIESSAYAELGLFEEFLTDPIYARVLPRLALRVIGRIGAETEGNFSTGDFYSDTLASFGEIVKDPKAAANYAWKWIAIYSTRGASFGALTALLHDRQLGLGISILQVSTGMSYLDSLRHGANRGSYSIPAKIKTDCFFGKPYHFWLSAYFARKIRLEGAKREPSTLAAFLTGAFYEYGSQTAGRDPTRALTDPSDGQYPKWEKINLYFDALGARFGWDAEDRSAKEIDHDDALVEALKENPLLSKVEIFQKQTKDQIRYLYWVSKYRPYDLLENVLKK